MTRAAIVGAALDIALRKRGWRPSPQAVADRVEPVQERRVLAGRVPRALRSAVIEEYDRRFLWRCVRLPAYRHQRGLPRLCHGAPLDRAVRVVLGANSGCLYTAGAFELDDREAAAASSCCAVSWAGGLPSCPCCVTGRRVGAICAATAMSSKPSARFV